MGTETLFEEIMAENFFNLIKETDIRVQVAQKIPNKSGQETHIKTHYSENTMLKDKEKLLKAARKSILL